MNKIIKVVGIVSGGALALAGFSACSFGAKPQPAPAPVTVTAPAPTKTVTAPAPTKTVTQKAKPAPTKTVTAKPKKHKTATTTTTSFNTASKIAAENDNCGWTKQTFDNGLADYTSSWCRGVIIDVSNGMSPTEVAVELGAQLDETDGDYYVVGSDYVYFTPDQDDAQYVANTYNGTIYTDNI